jgi:hypothetical protein
MRVKLPLEPINASKIKIGINSVEKLYSADLKVMR